MSALFAGQLNPSEAAHVFDAVDTLRHSYRVERDNNIVFGLDEIKADLLGNQGTFSFFLLLIDEFVYLAILGKYHNCLFSIPHIKVLGLTTTLFLF